MGCLSQLPPQSWTNNMLSAQQNSIYEESDINIRLCRDNLFCYHTWMVLLSILNIIIEYWLVHLLRKQLPQSIEIKFDA